jgi:hypothetical protein
VRLARKQLPQTARRVADEEDAALSAFGNACRGIEAGRFQWLKDRDDLWRLLVKITVRKARTQLVWILRDKRGGGGVRGDSALSKEGAPTEEKGFDQFEGPELEGIQSTDASLGLFLGRMLGKVAFVETQQSIGVGRCAFRTGAWEEF